MDVVHTVRKKRWNETVGPKRLQWIAPDHIAMIAEFHFDNESLTYWSLLHLFRKEHINRLAIVRSIRSVMLCWCVCISTLLQILCQKYSFIANWFCRAWWTRCSRHSLSLSTFLPHLKLLDHNWKIKYESSINLY